MHSLTPFILGEFACNGAIYQTSQTLSFKLGAKLELVAEDEWTWLHTWALIRTVGASISDLGRFLFGGILEYILISH